MSIRHVESKTRTDRLHCDVCGCRILKGVYVVFELDDCNEGSPMNNVYCPLHSKEFSQQVSEDMQHPFDLDDCGDHDRY